MKRWTSQYYLKEDKIYRGAFNYLRNDLTYAEETFDVYRIKDQNLAYVSEAIIKLQTGEILNIKVEYIITKEFLPTFVMVEKTIGKNQTKESYTYNLKNNTLDYLFESTKHEDIRDVIALAPRYHISTPTAVSSVLFVKSKKFDSNGKNNYNILTSNNQWDYIETPSFNIVILERESVSMENLVIENQAVQATVYKLFENLPESKTAKKNPYAKIYLSQHASIPYLIDSGDGTKIQIKYLNDLSESL